MKYSVVWVSKVCDSRTDPVVAEKRKEQHSQRSHFTLRYITCIRSYLAQVALESGQTELGEERRLLGSVLKECSVQALQVQLALVEVLVVQDVSVCSV